MRYGNVMGSRGQRHPAVRATWPPRGKSLPITDKRMTRFWITLPQAVQFVVDSFDLMSGGELYVPRIPSMKVLDLAEAVAPGAATHEIGIRPGEKLHEEMIAPDDSRRTLRLGDRYVIMPYSPAGATSRRRTGSRCRTAWPTAPTPTTCGSASRSCAT